MGRSTKIPSAFTFYLLPNQANRALLLPFGPFRVPVTLLRSMAAGGLQLPHQQLGRAALRRLQDRHGQPPADPLAGRLHRTLARRAGVPLVARELDELGHCVPVQGRDPGVQRRGVQHSGLGLAADDPAGGALLPGREDGGADRHGEGGQPRVAARAQGEIYNEEEDAWGGCGDWRRGWNRG